MKPYNAPDRRPYTEKEDETIVDYMLHYDLVSKTRGNAVWQFMSKVQVCPGRSWQSMKERFRMRVSKFI